MYTRSHRTQKQAVTADWMRRSLMDNCTPFSCRRREPRRFSGDGEGNGMNTHKITGGGGIQLHVVEAGNSKGRPILFIDGFSGSWLAWSRQISSDLANDYRLVAMDIRGHGLSDKPREGYSDSNCGLMM